MLNVFHCCSMRSKIVEVKEHPRHSWSQAPPAYSPELMMLWPRKPDSTIDSCWYRLSVQLHSSYRGLVGRAILINTGAMQEKSAGNTLPPVPGEKTRFYFFLRQFDCALEPKAQASVQPAMKS